MLIVCKYGHHGHKQAVQNMLCCSGELLIGHCNDLESFAKQSNFMKGSPPEKMESLSKIHGHIE